METVIENHETGEKKVLKGQLPAPNVHHYQHVNGRTKEGHPKNVAIIPEHHREMITKAANALVGKTADEVVATLKAVAKAKKPAAKMRPKPPTQPPPDPKKGPSEAELQVWYMRAYLRFVSNGAFVLGNLEIEDLKDIIVGMPAMNFMPYPEWKAARGYGEEKDAV